MRSSNVDSNNFGKKLKELRKTKGWTQQALAELAGIDEKHLSRLENGKYFPAYSTLNKLLKILEVSVDELLGVDIEKIKVNSSPVYSKIMQIINAAENDAELSCFLDAVKAVQKAVKLNKNVKTLPLKI